MPSKVYTVKEAEQMGAVILCSCSVCAIRRAKDHERPSGMEHIYTKNEKEGESNDR